MSNNDKPLDWSKFSETELQAISIANQNRLNGTTKPTFPYSAVVFEELAEILASIALVKPESAVKMVTELNVINTHLINIQPKLELDPTPTPEALQQFIIENAVCDFIITQFNGIIGQVVTAIEQAKGGDNGVRH